MTIPEAYDRYKHLDEVLSDPDFTPEGKDCDGCKLGRTLANILHDIWPAVKAEAQKHVAEEQ